MSLEIQTPENLDTATLLKAFLELEEGEHYRFLLPIGEATAVMQRVRVTLSRKRNIAKRRGIKIKEFRLKSEVSEFPSIVKQTPQGLKRVFVHGLPDTMLERQLNGNGFDLTAPLDLVDVWRHQTTTGKMNEVMDDLVRKD